MTKARSCFPAMYACLLPDLHEIAGDHGYMIAPHGSFARDLDLIAVPWTEDAKPARDLIGAIANRLGFLGAEHQDEPEEKPHGRLSWSIVLSGPAYLDVSVMPLATTGAERQGREEGRREAHEQQQEYRDQAADLGPPE